MPYMDYYSMNTPRLSMRFVIEPAQIVADLVKYQRLPVEISASANVAAGFVR